MARASGNFSVQVDGVADSLKALRMNKDVCVDAFFDELKATAYDIQRDAKKRAPTPGRNPYATGTLRADIQVSHDQGSSFVYNIVEYAKFIELGTVYMKSQPYMKPAYRKGLSNFKNNLEKRIGRSIKT